MKTSKWISLLFVALIAIVIVQSCSKDEELSTQSDQPSFSVRPDFETIDTRPADVIARSKITERDASPVELQRNTFKAGGKYALVIGISNYSGTANDLEYCDDDATDWKARLQMEGYSVPTLFHSSSH